MTHPPPHPAPNPPPDPPPYRSPRRLPPQLDPRAGWRSRRALPTRLLLFLVGVLLVGAVIGALLALALALLVPGRTGGSSADQPAPPTGAAPGSAAPSPPGSAAPSAAPVPLGRVLPPAAVTAFDPQGDRAEGNAALPRAYDGDPRTAWLTDRYRSAGFGGLKTGVGLLVDLGRPERVGSVRITLSAPGAGLELRAGAVPAAGVAGFAVVATAAPGAAAVTLRPTPATTARYWLVWLTALPPDGPGYRGGIAELSFRG